MGTATLTISDEVRADLTAFSWINWSEVAREEFVRQKKLTEAFEKAEKILSKSKLTEEQAIKLADELNRSVAEKYAKLLRR